jgi:hypothetical protein
MWICLFCETEVKPLKYVVYVTPFFSDLIKNEFDNNELKVYYKPDYSTGIKSLKSFAPAVNPKFSKQAFVPLY